MNVGCLVFPVPEREYMFLESVDEETEEILDEINWDPRTLGVILDVRDFDPPREYMRVRVLVEGVVGWTYTDYIKTINDCEK